MKEGSYQFIHIEAYGREGSRQTKTSIKKNGDKVATTKTKWSARDIFAEQMRLEGDCNHVKNPQQPKLLYGVDPLEILPMIEEWAENSKDAQGRKLRKDAHCTLVGVASLPRSMENQFEDFAEDTIKWLIEKYGDRLKSVVYHNDETHPHLHFSVVPRIGERFDDIHEGLKAKNEAKKNNKKMGDQNLAYIEAMRAYQDEFSKKVAMCNGLTRIGPGRRRLTRAQWMKEKAQAAYFADAKRVAMVHAQKGYKEGFVKGQSEAKSIGSKFGAWLTGLSGAWHKPTARVLADMDQIKKSAQEQEEISKKKIEQVKKEADRRVANVGNQITELKSKNIELEKDLVKSEEKIHTMFNVISWYEKHFGKPSNDLPKNK